MKCPFVWLCSTIPRRFEKGVFSSMRLGRNAAKKSCSVYVRVGQASILFYRGFFLQLIVSRDFFLMDIPSRRFIDKLAGHPLRGWPARLRGHKGSGLWKVWTVPSPPLPSPPLPSRAMSPKRQSAESAVADEPV